MFRIFGKVFGGVRRRFMSGAEVERQEERTEREEVTPMSHHEGNTTNNDTSFPQGHTSSDTMSSDTTSSNVVTPMSHHEGNTTNNDTSFPQGHTSSDTMSSDTTSSNVVTPMSHHEGNTTNNDTSFPQGHTSSDTMSLDTTSSNVVTPMSHHEGNTTNNDTSFPQGHTSSDTMSSDTTSSNVGTSQNTALMEEKERSKRLAEELARSEAREKELAAKLKASMDNLRLLDHVHMTDKSNLKRLYEQKTSELEDRIRLLDHVHMVDKMEHAEKITEKKRLEADGQDLLRRREELRARNKSLMKRRRRFVPEPATIVSQQIRELRSHLNRLPLRTWQPSASSPVTSRRTNGVDSSIVTYSLERERSLTLKLQLVEQERDKLKKDNDTLRGQVDQLHILNDTIECLQLEKANLWDTFKDVESEKCDLQRENNDLKASLESYKRSHGTPLSSEEGNQHERFVPIDEPADAEAVPEEEAMQVEVDQSPPPSQVGRQAPSPQPGCSTQPDVPAASTTDNDNDSDNEGPVEEPGVQSVNPDIVALQRKIKRLENQKVKLRNEVRRLSYINRYQDKENNVGRRTRYERREEMRETFEREGI